MTLEHQAQEFAAAVFHYGQTYSIEPAVVLKKPFSQVLAAYDLAILNSQQIATGSQKPDYSKHDLQYNEHATERNARGDATKVTKHAIIPLGGLADDPGATQNLNDIIQKLSG